MTTFWSKMIKAIPVATDEQKPGYYAQYRTIKFWHTVRDDKEGNAIMFNSEHEAENAARMEWWRHVNGDAQTNRGRHDREAKARAYDR